MDWHTLIDDELAAIRKRFEKRHAEELARQRRDQFWRDAGTRPGTGATHDAIKVAAAMTS